MDDCKEFLPKEMFENQEETKEMLEQLEKEDGRDIYDILLDPNSLWKLQKRCLRSMFKIPKKPI